MYDHHPDLRPDSLVLSRQAAARHAALNAIREERSSRRGARIERTLGAMRSRTRLLLDGWIRRLGLG